MDAFSSVFNKSKISSKAAIRSINDKNKGKNEIFADVFEKISVTLILLGFVQLNRLCDKCPSGRVYLNEKFLIRKPSFKISFE
jgi:hypothetical protein